MGGSASEENHYPCDDEADDSEYFDRCEPEFSFSKEGYRYDIQDKAYWMTLDIG